MATQRNYYRSFAGGEVSQDMWGRIDDGKYQTGLAECRNFMVRPQGPIENRPGTTFVSFAKYHDQPVRLIPFIYSIDQSMVLEVGHLYIRFHTLGATLICATAAGRLPPRTSASTLAGHSLLLRAITW